MSVNRDRTTQSSPCLKMEQRSKILFRERLRGNSIGPCIRLQNMGGGLTSVVETKHKFWDDLGIFLHKRVMLEFKLTIKEESV